jgi:hypothetical protein
MRGFSGRGRTLAWTSAHASTLIPQSWEASTGEGERTAPSIAGAPGIRRSRWRVRARDEGERFLDGRGHRQGLVESGHAQDALYRRRRRGEHQLRPRPRSTVLQVE